jgi:hypothetical protein
MHVGFADTIGKMMEIFGAEERVVAIEWPEEEEAFHLRLIVRHVRPKIMRRQDPAGAVEGKACFHQEVGGPH